MEQEPMSSENSSDLPPPNLYNGHPQSSRRSLANLINLPHTWFSQVSYTTAAASPYSGLPLPFWWGTMGHQVSHLGSANHQAVVEGQLHDVEKTCHLLPELHQEPRISQQELSKLKTHLQTAQEALQARDARVKELEEEVDKLRSVLQQKVTGSVPDPLSCLTSFQSDHVVSDCDIQNRKKQGVSGESSTCSTSLIKLKHYEKDLSSKRLIKNALRSNDFLKNLDRNQIHEIINCMYERRVIKDDFIIRENEAGNHLFVSAEGTLQVLKAERVVGNMAPGRAFGELAVLYGCTRTASVRATEAARIWVLERQVFQAIMVRTGMERQRERIDFLQSVESLSKLSQDKLAKISDVLEVDFYEQDEHIVREGQIGDTFYIIAEGQVKVTQRIVGVDEPQLIRVLKKGEYFGEKALLTEERRTANVVAAYPGVELLTLNREAFVNLIGDLREFHERDYGDLQRQAEWIYQRSSSSSENSSHRLGDDLVMPSRSLTPSDLYKDLQLDDLEVVSTLGVGGFGRVELVQLRNDKSKAFALKCLKKRHVVDMRQQEHVYSEKRIMTLCRSRFIVRMYKTFKDTKFVYMLMEACLGGELWTVLRKSCFFDDNTARFCVACVLEALQYLHSRGVVYRDLKPENLLIAQDGYIKLVDFGFAKHLPAGRKTWTFCGTPEYVAPEVILNKGHDHAVDVWAVGILIFELTAGVPPFTSSDPMKTYNVILRGIDSLEFPKRVSHRAQSLIKRLCRENPPERLGCQRNGLKDVMKHKWFQGFDWEGLENITLIPPFKQKINCPTDASNFDQYPFDASAAPDEFSGWDDEF